MKRFIKVIAAVMCVIPALLIGCGNSSNTTENNSSQSIANENENNNLAESTEKWKGLEQFKQSYIQK